jgi:lambda family phage portal protein
VAYWLFPEHPGSDLFNASRQSVRVPAEAILHIYYHERPGQMRGPSWFAPVLLRFKDHDEFEDATLMKQKIAACLAVLTSDIDGSAPALGATDTADPLVDSLEPGMILNVPPGRQVSVVQPPTVREYADYTRTTLRSIATGLGVSYEELTGDYSGVNFSSARMARLAHWDNVEDWRWQMLVPQFCGPVWGWAMQAASVMGMAKVPGVSWSAPPMPMIEPDKEGLAHQRNIRTGITTLPEVLRERGYDPDEVLVELAAHNKQLDKLGIVLDSDPRKTTQAGNPVQAAQQGAAAAPADETKPADDKTPPPAAEE